MAYVDDATAKVSKICRLSTSHCMQCKNVILKKCILRDDALNSTRNLDA
jgi:hypothetical protein